MREIIKKNIGVILVAVAAIVIELGMLLPAMSIFGITSSFFRTYKGNLSFNPVVAVFLLFAVLVLLFASLERKIPTFVFSILSGSGALLLFFLNNVSEKEMGELIALFHFKSGYYLTLVGGILMIVVGILYLFLGTKNTEKVSWSIKLTRLGICLAIFVVLFLIFDQGEGVLTNKNIGDAEWSDRSPDTMTWDDAKQYCINLTEGGHNDWRLPTISELRTAIKNCAGTESGGSCGITDTWLAAGSCGWSEENCGGCHAKNNYGTYSKLGDRDGFFWSSSTVSDDTDFAWQVFFYNGRVTNTGKANSGYVRCVR